MTTIELVNKELKNLEISNNAVNLGHGWYTDFTLQSIGTYTDICTRTWETQKASGG
jgi:hypothetical protein